MKRSRDERQYRQRYREWEEKTGQRRSSAMELLSMCCLCQSASLRATKEVSECVAGHRGIVFPSPFGVDNEKKKEIESKQLQAVRKGRNGWSNKTQVRRITSDNGKQCGHGERRWRIRWKINQTKKNHCQSKAPTRNSTRFLLQTDVGCFSSGLGCFWLPSWMEKYE